MGSQILKQDIGRNFENDIWNEEYGQCSIVFRPVNYIQVFLQAEDCCVTDVHAVRKGQRKIVIQLCSGEANPGHTDPRMRADT